MLSTAKFAKNSSGCVGIFAPNQFANVACFTPGTWRTSSMYRFGSGMMKVTLWRVPRRSCAACSAPTFHADSTVRSMTNASSATAQPATVNVVRNQLRFRLRAAMRKS